MSKKILIATCFTVLTATAATAAKLPFPVDANGTTNIADCAKAPADYRNECISRARPVTAKQKYAAQAPVKAPVAAKVKAAATKAVAAAPKGPRGFKIAKDGTTSIYDCKNARADVRDVCLSRARPLTGRQLARYEGAPNYGAATKVAAVAKKVEPVAKPVMAAKTPGKGFVVAKDGTTDINMCGKANPEYRNECISRARPVKGAEIYRAAKSKS